MILGFSSSALAERFRTLAPTLIVIGLLIQIPVIAVTLSITYKNNLERFPAIQAQRALGLTTERVMEAIESGSEHRVLVTIGSAKRRTEDGVMQLLRDLWERPIEQYPELDWDLLNRESVRVELAVVLADVSRQNRVNVSLEPILEQLRQSAEFSPDETVQRKAIFSVGLFDDPHDVPLLLQLTSSENERTFRMAVGALAGMCNDEARGTLENLRQTLPADRASYLREASDRFDLTDESDWCRCRRFACPETTPE